MTPKPRPFSALVLKLRLPSRKAVCRECYREWKGVFRKEAFGTCDKCGRSSRFLILVPKL